MGVVEFPDRDDGVDLLSALQGGEHVHQGPAEGVSAGIGDLPDLQPVHPAVVGEHQEMIVGVGGVDIGDVILLPGAGSHDSLSAPSLGPVGVNGLTFDVSLLCHGDDHGFVLDEVLDVEIPLILHDLGPAAVTVLLPDLLEFRPDDPHPQGRILQDPSELVDGHFQIVAFLLQGPYLQGGELLQPHLEDGLALLLAELEPEGEGLPGGGGVPAPPDDPDDLIDVLQGDEEPLHDVRPLLGLVEIEHRPPGHDLHPVIQEQIEHLPESEDPWLVVHQCKVDDPEAVLHLGVLEKLVEDHLVAGTAFQFDDDPHPLPIRLVPEVGDPLDLLVLHQFRDGLDELGLVHHVRNLVHDEPFAVPLLFHMGLGPHGKCAAPRGVRLHDPSPPVDDTACGKIRTRYVFQ